VLVGVLGGTFDPIHKGHTYLAKCAQETFGLDQVLFMVARRPPHKARIPLTSKEHRFAMVALATREHDTWIPSSLELDADGPSYTIRTLENLSKSNRHNTYCFIAGGDSLHDLHLWKDCGRLLEEFSFIFVQRVGVEAEVQNTQLPNRLKNTFRIVQTGRRQTLDAGASYLVLASPPDISSTGIRRFLSSGSQPSSEYLSPEVLEYIRKNQLYE